MAPGPAPPSPPNGNTIFASSTAAKRASVPFGVIPVDGADLESVLSRLPATLPPQPQGLAPVKIASAVARHDLEPSIGSLPPHELRETLRQNGVHAFGHVSTFRRPIESLIRDDATHLWFKPPSQTEPGPPPDCVALLTNKGSASVPDILIVDVLIYGLQCSRLPSLRGKTVRHPKLDLVGIPLIPCRVSYPEHLGDLDEHLYRQDLEWLYATLVFQRPPPSVPRSLWRSGAESRFEALTRVELIEKLRHVYCLWHCAVDLGVCQSGLFHLLSEVYTMTIARL